MIYWSIQLLRVESNNSKINKYSKGQQRYEQGRDIEKAILNKYCVLRLCKAPGNIEICHLFSRISGDRYHNKTSIK